MKKLTVLFLFLQLFIKVTAQTFSGSGGAIPDDGNSIRFPIIVSGLPGTIDTSFGLISVYLNITHTYDSDLDIWLIAPDSSYIELSTGNGGAGDNYISTSFIDTAPVFISNGVAPFFGAYKPESPMYIANNGLNANAVWQLLIHDTYPFADAGTLNGWSISFGNNPPHGLSIQSSNLPIVKINTLGQSIPDDPKVTVQMQIIDNGAGIRNNVTDTVFAYKGQIGIEIRGSSSQGFPKKSYGFETLDSNGVETDTSFFGMPSESDWILGANYTDKTFMRNVLTYSLSQEMGHYASRSQYCELLINGQYQGIYVFTEKIKRDAGRVAIAKMTAADTIGDDLTGGYILKVDKITGSAGGGWTTLFFPPNGGPKPIIQHEYPDVNDILPVQANYIKNYCDSFEITLNGPSFTHPLNGYRKYIDINSWIDFFILTELSKNVDGYRISTFFYKEKDSDGGLLHMGPVWDYDIAWGNADYNGGDVTSGYAYQFNSPGAGQQVPFWWNKLLQDPFYQNTLRCRWEDLRTNQLSTATLHNWIDSVGALLDESQVRNFTLWPILGVYVWPNPSPIPPDYPGVMQELKNWITNRATWLDNNLPGNCSLAGLNQQNLSTNVRAYPNPAVDETWILLPEAIRGTAGLRIVNTMGQVIDEGTLYIDDHSIPLDLRTYPQETLIIEITLTNKTYRTVLVKR